jgi:3,4-dehydroadipyl-CoA semialdehyde dehydrogenase
MKKLENYVAGRWVAGSGVDAVLTNPATEEALVEASTEGIDRRAMLDHARRTGGETLRGMTFAQRGALLESWSKALHGAREELIAIAMANGGNTRGDAKFDLDGAIGTLAAYAEIGKSLGERKERWDGEAIDMGRTSRMSGRHVFLPRRGVAVHVNAFNFPAWGLAEKAACAILAGMPVVTKPATISAMLAHRIVELLVEKGLVPAGVLSLLCGGAGDLLDHLDYQDCLAFTGSARTGHAMRTHPRVLERGVRVNIEADSLNAAVLAPDVDPEVETFDFFVQQVAGEMTQKAGQKCTAIRRILVPLAAREAFVERLRDQLARIVVGNPAAESVRMGPLAGPGPLADTRAALAELLRCTKVALGDPRKAGGEGAPAGKGAFLHPLLLTAESADSAPAVHAVEAFGPVATMIPYDGSPAEAARIVGLGQGSLVSIFYTDDREFASGLVAGMGACQGRLVWGSKRTAGAAPGPGAVFPLFVHGGPGRAGAGEELGGLRGLDFYSQRVAIQGFGPLVEKLF